MAVMNFMKTELNIKTMKLYRVIFSNTSSWEGRASDRADAIRMACIARRGYLSMTAQSKYVVSAKQVK